MSFAAKEKKNTKIKDEQALHTVLQTLSPKSVVCPLKSKFKPEAILKHRESLISPHLGVTQTTDLKAPIYATIISFDFDVLQLRSRQKSTTFGRVMTPYTNIYLRF